MRFLLLFVVAFAAAPAWCQNVDPLTGRAVIGVPLVEVSAYGLSASVSLSHHGGALKVNEGPGNAGMGWSMNVNGGIFLMREMRGLPDETTNVGWRATGKAQAVQNFTPAADDNLAVCTDESADWTALSALAAGDPEPDIYYFQIPGYSGKYVFGTDGKPKMSPYRDLTISDDGKTFTTSTGIRYTFDTNGDKVDRTAIPFDESNPATVLTADLNRFKWSAASFVVNFPIKTILNLVNNKTVDFTYATGEKELSAKYVTAIGPSQSTTADTLYYLLDNVTPQYLTKITLASYAIDIAYANRLIDKVTVTESETGDAEVYDLIYKAITSTGDTGFPKLVKPFLSQVKQQRACVAYPSFVFTYEGIDTTSLTAPGLNWRSGYGEDIYGYFNGQLLNRNVPTIYFYNTETGANRFRTALKPGVAPTATLPGGDRAVAGDKVAFGAVKRVYAPAGGFTEFEYGPNTYFAQTSIGEELAGPGVRVNKVTVWGGEASRGRQFSHAINPAFATIKRYEYGTTNANTVSSGKILYPPSFAFAIGTTLYRSQTDLGPGASVMYSRVREIVPGQGYTVYEFDLQGIYPDGAATISKMARPAGASCSAGYMKNGQYTFPYAPLTDVDFARGLLSRMTQYTEGGILTNERILSYTMPQAAASIKGVRIESASVSGNVWYFYSVYQIPVNQSRILSQEIIRTLGDSNGTDATTVTTTYTYNGRNRVTKTTATNGDGSVVTQEAKYADDFTITSPTAGDGHAEAVKQLNSNNRGGEVIETYGTFTPRGGAAVTTGASHTIYKAEGNDVLPSRRMTLPQDKTFTPATTTTSGSTQGIALDSDYIETLSIDYADKLPANQLSPSLVPVATHFATQTGVPIATFANCRAEHAVYEGFDHASANGLTPVPNTGITPVAGWTGKKAMPLNTSYTLNSTSLVTKGDNVYRFSCWVYATSGATITLKAYNSATVMATLNLPYTTTNKWSYLEGFIDVTAAASPIRFWVSTNAAIVIDEVTIMPRKARVQSSTYLPLTGPTSKTDDLGNSTIVTYDALGRPSETFDAQRNLVSVQEYMTQRQGKVSPNAMFTSNRTEYIKGQSITFTAAATCLTGLTYQWTFVDAQGGTTTATGASATTSFSPVGLTTIKLTVTAPDGQSDTFSQTVCVMLPTLNLVINVSPNKQVHHCGLTDEQNKTFTASLPGLDATGLEIEYQWIVLDAAQNEMIPQPISETTGPATVCSVNYTDYYMTCKVVIRVPDPVYGAYECSYQEIKLYEEVSIDYIDDRPCE